MKELALTDPRIRKTNQIGRHEYQANQKKICIDFQRTLEESKTQLSKTDTLNWLPKIAPALCIDLILTCRLVTLYLQLTCAAGDQLLIDYRASHG